jgi:lipopolysaccharide transport system ATP-binding protein
MNYAIEIENLNKEYNLGSISHKNLIQDIKKIYNNILGKDKKNLNENKKIAIRDINLQIESGKKIGLIGKNGSGKSTLLKIISSVTSPTYGTIRLRGKVSSLLEVGVGFHPELTGRENIYLSGSIIGVKKNVIDSEISSIIKFSGVEDYIDTPIKRYSSGMIVRLGFAVSTTFDSDILIIDEILAVGDLHFRENSIRKMLELSKDHAKTIIFVSHNMDLIKNFCDETIFMKNGEVDFFGQTELAIKKYQESK